MIAIFTPHQDDIIDIDLDHRSYKIIHSKDDLTENFTSIITYGDWYNYLRLTDAYEKLKIKQPELF